MLTKVGVANLFTSAKRGNTRSAGCKGMSLGRLRFAPAVQISLLCLRACSAMGNKQEVPVHKVAPKPRVSFTEEELRARLTPEEYHVTQNKGTERAWTGKERDSEL